MFEAKIKSMQDEKFVKWVGLLIILLQAAVDVIFSNTIPAFLDLHLTRRLRIT